MQTIKNITWFQRTILLLVENSDYIGFMSLFNFSLVWVNINLENKIIYLYSTIFLSYIQMGIWFIKDLFL